MKNQTGTRISFGKIPEIIEAPDLLNIQLESWDSFLQSDTGPARRKNKGLQSVFKMNFPITDARENFLLEFVEFAAFERDVIVKRAAAFTMLANAGAHVACFFHEIGGRQPKLAHFTLT